jgi:hypothetical protein
MRQETQAAPRGPYIHSFLFDSIVFIFSPLICLLFVLSLAGTPWLTGEVALFGFLLAQPALFAFTVLNQGHVASVLVRSHLNRAVFRRHRTKILLAPALLLLAMNVWQPIFVGCLILMGFWNLYHYALQNFGIARFYDARVGIFSRQERAFDLLACLLITLLPIAIGSENFLNLLNEPEKLEAARLAFLIPVFFAVGTYFSEQRPFLELVFFSVSGAYFLYYGARAAYGRPVSWRKLLFMSQLMLLVGFGWIHFQWFVGFLGITLLHSVQYYGLLSISERKAVAERLGNLKTSTALWVTPALVLAIGILFGYYSATIDPMPVKPVEASWHVFPFSLVVMMNLVHFWFDGFIWGRESAG